MPIKHDVVAIMIFRPDECGEALGAGLDHEGVVRMRNSFDYLPIAREVVSPYAVSGWQGTDTALYQYEMLQELPQATTEFVQEVGQLAMARYANWVPDYVMTRTTTEGMELHSDRMEFRYFSLFAYLRGRTDFYYETPVGKLRGLVLNPGDMLALRQPAHMLDQATRVAHGVGKSKLRCFVNIAYINAGVSSVATGTQGAASTTEYAILGS